MARLTGWKQSEIETLARTNGDIPFTLTPKPTPPGQPEPISEERKLYEQTIWWRGLFPPETNDQQP